MPWVRILYLLIPGFGIDYCAHDLLIGVRRTFNGFSCHRICKEISTMQIILDSFFKKCVGVMTVGLMKSL